MIVYPHMIYFDSSTMTVTDVNSIFLIGGGGGGE